MIRLAVVEPSLVKVMHLPLRRLRHIHFVVFAVLANQVTQSLSRLNHSEKLFSFVAESIWDNSRVRVAFVFVCNRS